MKKLLIFALLAPLLCGANFAFAQTPSATGFTNGNNSRGDPNWVEVSPSNPLPVTTGGSNLNQVRGAASSTDGAAHSIIPANTTLKTYITDWECSNTSSTAVIVTFNDSASTPVIVPASGGNNKSLNVPLVTNTINTAFQFTSSTGQTTVYCAAQGYYGP